MNNGTTEREHLDHACHAVPCLSWNHEDWSLNYKHPSKQLGMVAHASEAETRRSLDFGVQLVLLSC